MFDKQLIKAMQGTDKWFIRFCSFIELTDSCWLWKGAGGHFEQAVFGYPGKTVRAARLAYNLANDNEPGTPVPKGMALIHSCDNQMCVNPDHITLATHYDNQQDSIKKGRKPKGRPLIKLSYELAEKIRSIYEAGGITQLELAKRYDVSLRNMQLLLGNHIWKKRDDVLF